MIFSFGMIAENFEVYDSARNRGHFKPANYHFSGMYYTLKQGNFNMAAITAGYVKKLQDRCVCIERLA